MSAHRVIALLGGSAVLLVIGFLVCALIWESATENTKTVIQVFLAAVALVAVVALAGLSVRYGLTGVWA